MNRKHPLHEGRKSRLSNEFCLFLSLKPTTLDERRRTGLKNLEMEGQRAAMRGDRWDRQKHASTHPVHWETLVKFLDISHTWYMSHSCLYGHRERARTTHFLISGSNCRGIPKIEVSQVKYHRSFRNIWVLWMKNNHTDRHVLQANVLLTVMHALGLIDCLLTRRIKYALFTACSRHRSPFIDHEWKIIKRIKTVKCNINGWYCRLGLQSMTRIFSYLSTWLFMPSLKKTGKSVPLPLRSITPFLQAQSRQTFHFLARLLIWLISTLISHRHAQNGVSLTLRIILCN